MKILPSLALLVLVAVLPAASAQMKDAELKDYLAAVTDRGHALYDYDQAAWHGTDAIFALHPDMSNAAHYICTRTTKGWRVVFPRWNATHTGLTVAYEATETAPGQYAARKLDPPEDAGDDLLAKERALELVLSDFQHPNRPYNAAILHGPNSTWYVYFYPGQTKDTVWPIGGDVRYTISPDGLKIVEKRQLHKAILDMQLDPAKKPVSGFHTHVLSDVPEDTDVFYVLNRRPLLPEYVGTLGGWFFVIQADGKIESIAPCVKGNPLPCKKR
jgi:hypothetical protein